MSCLITSRRPVKGEKKKKKRGKKTSDCFNTTGKDFLTVIFQRTPAVIRMQRRGGGEGGKEKGGEKGRISFKKSQDDLLTHTNKVINYETRGEKG